MSRQGVEAPAFSLNRLTRQMILTGTCASAFDSIIRLSRSSLSEKLPKVPLISSSKKCHLSALQTITAQYITLLPLKASVLSLGQTGDICLQPSLHVKVMLELFLEFLFRVLL